MYVILALLCASILIVYLQHRALVTLKRQAQLVLQEISANTATRIANDVRRSFEAPVFETLTAVNHPLLSAGRLDLVAEHYAKGLQNYSHVERFFIWENMTDEVLPGEVLFFGGEPKQAAHVKHVTLSVNGKPVTGFYRDQGRQSDAESLFKRVLAMYEKALGPDHPGVATALNNLAVLYQEQGRAAEAEPLAKRALAMREKAFGPDHPQLLNAIHNLAELYRTLGRNAEAEALTKRAEAIRRKSRP